MITTWLRLGACLSHSRRPRPLRRLVRSRVLHSYHDFLAAMAVSDYDADATELLETYGQCCNITHDVRVEQAVTDFLMKYIIIGVCSLRLPPQK